MFSLQAVANVDGFITGFAISPDGGRMLGSICNGDCNFVMSETGPSTTTFYWSDDGGMTWSQIGKIPYYATPVAVLPDRIIYSANVPSPNVFDGDGVVFDRHALPERLSLSLARVERRKEFLGALPDAIGTVGWLVEDGHPTVVGWYPNAPEPTPLYVSLQAGDGTYRTRFRTYGLLSFSTWLDDRLLVVSQERLFEVQPTLLDPEAGVAYPIRGVFETSPFGPGNFVMTVQRGPFLRVSGPQCLPVNARPGAADIVGCAAPGVLLRPLSEVRLRRGVEWQIVQLPNGLTGWVPKVTLDQMR